MSKIKLKSEYPGLDKYEFDDGDILYYKKDTSIVHNPYGAAIIGEDGFKGYWIENKLHRLDGPAIIFPDGEGGYYINDTALSEEEFEMHPERLKSLGKEYLLCLK